MPEKLQSSAGQAKKELATRQPKGAAKRLARPKRARSQSFSNEHVARAQAFLEAARSAGYLKGEKSERVSGRVSPRLMSAAKARSGIDSATMLLEYALSKVALEDDFGSKLLARKGSIPEDVEL